MSKCAKFGHFSLIAGRASPNSPSHRKLRRFRRNFRWEGRSARSVDFSLQSRLNTLTHGFCWLDVVQLNIRWFGGKRMNLSSIVDSIPNDASSLAGEGWASRNMRKRYGILMLNALLGWTLLGFVPMFESIVANGMLLDTYSQLAFLTFTNYVAVVFCVATHRLLNCRIPGGQVLQKLGDGARPWTIELSLVTIAIGSITPLTLAAFFCTEFPFSGGLHVVVSVISISMGGILAWFGLAAVGRIKCRLIGSSGDHDNYFPFETKDCEGWLNQLSLTNQMGVYLRRLGNRIGFENADYQFAGYLLILAVTHWLTARWSSGAEVRLTSAPSMVVLLVWIACMLFGGIANLLDQFRFPIIAIALLGITLWQIPWGSTRPLETVQDDSNAQFVRRIAAIQSAENAHLLNADRNKESRQTVIARVTKDLNEVAWNSIKQRMSQERDKHADPTKGKTLVVATCPGGGIHAAAWTACVLESISREYSDFADSVCVISGVSGGSVGALCFVSKEYHQEIVKRSAADPPQPQALPDVVDAPSSESALELASRSALEPIAFGMISDDLYGAFLPPLSLRDRGQRLEDSLSLRLPKSQQNLTMGNWGDCAIEGRMPIVIFNSTDAASGRRILFDTVPTPRRLSSVGLNSRPINYRELMEVGRDVAFDVKPSTAARTSATFPYISPFTRPNNASPHGRAVAICDGGYADNEGIVTALNWVEFLLRRWAMAPKIGETRPFDRILILRIEPNATIDSNNPPATSGLAAWLRWLSGPAETIVKVRSTSQSERGNMETDLAALNLELHANHTEPASNPGETKPEMPKMFSSGPLQAYDFDLQSERTASRQHNSSKADNRRIWNEQVEAFKQRLEDKNPKLKSEPAIRTQATRSIDPNEPRSEAELPVIVRTIAFQNSDQVIPLNWKLTKEQKLWYPLSWELCSAPGSLLRETLDRHFTPRSTGG
jgi:hypothetical protein